MFNKISSFVLAILLFAVLAGSANNIAILAVSLGILILATFIINLRRIGLSWPHLLLPILYLLAVGSVYMIITGGPTIKLSFLLASAIAFYLVESTLGQESHFLQNIFLLSILAFYLGIFALNFYLHLNTVIVALLVFAVTYLVTIQGFAGFSLPAKKYFYLLTALSLAEAAWGLTLWPTYYVVDAVVLFALFYLIWIFSFSAFFGKLSLKKIYLQLGLVGFVLAVTLLSASWQPLIR